MRCAVIALFIAVITATRLRTFLLTCRYVLNERGKGGQANPLICRNAPEDIRPRLMHGRNTRKADDAPYLYFVITRSIASPYKAEAASLPIHQPYMSK